MTTPELEAELAQYVGLPKCQDCGWKWDTDITNNCHCRGEITPERQALYEKAFDRARFLQFQIFTTH